VSLIGWIIIGGVAGWIASAVVSAPRSGCLWNIIIGWLGAVVGGIIWVAVTDDRVDRLGLSGVLRKFDFDLASLGIATVGAIVLLLVINTVTGRSRRF
jgi:uncharacterized membrane protein YeaQ/YmgE (transglycosylase-associated protein family)